jgi:alpha-glucosidase
MTAPNNSVGVIVLFLIMSPAAAAVAQTTRSTTAPATAPATVPVFAPAPARPVPVMDPPEKEFFSKRVDFEGIAIKAHRDVEDQALFEAHARLSMLMAKLPNVRVNLREAGAELHVIGRNQSTSDLPEWRHMKGKPFDGNLTIDQRTRGMGGRLTSCGEENLLRLPRDRYRGRDICVHEFAHNIYNRGIPAAVRQKFKDRYKAALEEGLWVGSYAGSNDNEFFAEMTMWYFGTHGDLRMKGKKPGNGRQGLKDYDPRTLALLDDFYGGRMEIPILKGAASKPTTATAPSAPTPGSEPKATNRR